MKIIAFFKLVRFPNLAIVALTQYLLQYLLLVPALDKAGLSPILDANHFFLLVVTTMLIATGGYLVNDLLDYESDLINKPEAVFVHRVFPNKLVWFFYGTTTLVGFAIAWYLARSVENLTLVLIFPAAVSLLYFYSKKLKKLPLLGNVTVAIFCAFVAGVVLFAERENFAKMGEQGGVVRIIFGGYLVFAFLSTLLREIVKDLEDKEGDSRLGLQTLPIRFGEKIAKNWALGVGVALLCSLLLFVSWFWQLEGETSALVTAVGIGLLLVYTLVLVHQAASKADYTKTSLLTKTLMLSGLVLLVVCKFAGNKF